MLEERTLATALDAANVDEMRHMLLRPGAEEIAAFRAYLGDEVYQRLHGLSLRRSSGSEAKGNVVVIPGFLGSMLTAGEPFGRQQLWPNPLGLAAGELSRLCLDSSGLHERAPDGIIHATGILKRFYGELLLSLAARWEVRAFWYDWRKDVRLAASNLLGVIDSWFPENEPVHFVTHGAGSLVARAFIRQHPARFQRGSRLVMLGLPQHAFAEEVLLGKSRLAEALAALDSRRSSEEISAILGSFAGLYGMLPSPGPDTEALYRADHYLPLHVSALHLDAARALHDQIASVVDPERMAIVLGSRGIEERCRWRPAGTDAGDVLRTLSGLGGVPIFFAEGGDDGLPSHRRTLDGLDALLEGGHVPLASEPSKPGAVTGPAGAREGPSLIEEIVRHLHGRRGEPIYRPHVGSDERRVEALLMRDLAAEGASVADEPPEPSLPLPAISLRIVRGDLEGPLPDELPPVDALAVGCWVGGSPGQTMQRLDRALEPSFAASGAPAGERVLAQLVERGVIRGELAHLFFLDDPRAPGRRSIAVAGMGVPGRFGVPEDTVLVRELTWALGRLGKRHLATTLLGTSRGNLSVRDAASAWVRGLKHALTGAHPSAQLTHVTFLVPTAARMLQLDAALRAESEEYDKRRRFDIHYEPLPEAARQKLAEVAAAEPPEHARHQLGLDVGDHARHATRVTITFEDDAYHFGAMTEYASVPERSIAVDRRLVERANDELAAEADSRSQLERGQFLGKLLLPGDLQGEILSGDPLVLTLDTTTARIHWELVAAVESGRSEPLELFLGTSRGLTRQLRSAFAAAPDPPPPPQRRLRVVVIADPAEDRRLPGAEEEGAAVADLFERFNVSSTRHGNSVEVVRFFGPSEASRTAVLRQLMLRACDVLHFAGHCVYDEKDPAASGWIFSNGERITARELSRVDRVPRFVFSNACESGVTPDRSELRSAGLAPTFAEAFFARGVANFVCTAWPVEDDAAREFAVHLYAGLLGMPPACTPPQGSLPMHKAMQAARRNIHKTGGLSRTWCAYQSTTATRPSVSSTTRRREGPRRGPPLRDRP
jgi:hypothetical protein